MESNIETIVIPIAEAIGVDVSRYTSLMSTDNLYESIDSLFRSEEVRSISISKLPWQYSWEYKNDILEDAAVVALLDAEGSEAGIYVVRAMNVRVETTDPRVSRLKRRLVFIGKDLISLHSDKEVSGLDLRHLKIMSYR